MTFQEIADVVRDIKYQEMLSTPPEPVSNIKKPKREAVEQFLRNNEITLKSLLLEPLGRYFLDKYADVETYESEKINHFKRDPKGFQHQLLDFTSDFVNLGKRDQQSIVSLLDVVLLIERHDLIEFLDEALDPSRLLSFAGVEIINLPAGETEEDRLCFDVLKKEIEQEIGEIPFNQLKSARMQESETTISISKQQQGTKPKSEPNPVRLVQNNAPHVLHPSTSLKTYASAVDTSAVEESEVNGGLGSVLKTGDEKSSSDIKLNLAARDISKDKLTAWSAKTLLVNKKIMKSLEHHLKSAFEDFVADERTYFEFANLKYYASLPVTEKNVKAQRPLGQGAYGKVSAVIVTEIGVILALKQMRKKHIKAKKAKKQVKAELETLKSLALHPSPYCMRLRYAYTSKDSYNVIIPLAIGGDLKYQLSKGKFKLDRAKIYAAEIAYGLAHLHNLGYINRDLKLRNILLDVKGHCKISDFGLAVQAGNKKVKGRAGTEGYWSPENISKEEYAYDCDWWSYGCCLFELIAGVNPFATRHTGLKTRNEGTLSGEIKFLTNFDEHGKELVTELLKFDKNERICTKRSSIDELMDKKYAFWKDVDLQAIRLGSGPSPWIPELGKIYAAKVKDIEYTKPLGKVKLLKEDAIDEFKYFCDEDLHQEDLCRILHKHTLNPRLMKLEWSDDEDKLSKTSCECAIS